MEMLCAVKNKPEPDKMKRSGKHKYFVFRLYIWEEII